GDCVADYAGNAEFYAGDIVGDGGEHRVGGIAADGIDFWISAGVARGANEPGGCVAKRMKTRHEITFLAEVRESFFMALNAVAAHKLRSCLTLLGVLIGVFSIIVVMTAMRVLKSSIESEMSQLGANTFAIQKWPVVQFEG